MKHLGKKYYMKNITASSPDPNYKKLILFAQLELQMPKNPSMIIYGEKNMGDSIRDTTGKNIGKMGALSDPLFEGSPSRTAYSGFLFRSFVPDSYTGAMFRMHVPH